jgi:diacylglycerol kinase (ATP)
VNTSVKTLIILNPHAGGGRAGRLWHKIEPLLWEELGELVIAVTQHPGEVAQHLEKARIAGLTRVITIGGDGTNHALVNELIRLNRRYPDEPPMTFASLPIGTGRDWARALGVPFSPKKAVAWIKQARPALLDLGSLTMDGEESRHFLNIASVGISGVIVNMVNRLTVRRPWTFYKSTVQSLWTYQPPHLRIKLDGQLWYDAKALLCAVANGSMFGHGLRIAPNALYDDGLFDVVAIEALPRWEAVIALNSLYSGSHLQRKDVHIARAHTVEVEADGKPLELELDGEGASGHQLRFELLPRALRTLTAASV